MWVSGRSPQAKVVASSPVALIHCCQFGIVCFGVKYGLYCLCKLSCQYVNQLSFCFVLNFLNQLLLTGVLIPSK